MSNTIFSSKLPPLFTHQHEATSSALTELESHARTKVLMACGTGKTRVGPELAIKRNAKTIIVYLPSLALIRQTLPVWREAMDMEFLCVCSDRSVANKSDEIDFTRDDLVAELGIARASVSSDPSDVHSFLSAKTTKPKVVFSTYQSADAVGDGQPEVHEFDLGIYDEAHRTAGKAGLFSSSLVDTHTRIAKRVFMTATPKHVTYRKKNKAGEGAVVYSMDDEVIYGRTAYHLSIRKAINLNIIADYKVLVSIVDDKMIASELSAQNAQAGRAGLESIAHAIAIRNAMNQYGVKKCVTFHDSVADAKQFAGSSVIHGELDAATFHVNGSMKARDRNDVMDRFAAAVSGVITNAKCLTEGVDVPEIDLIAFLHPKRGQIDIIQAIGRALRMPSGSSKTTAYILLPLYVSEIENGGMERALDEHGYDTIFQVLQALREQDEAVNQYLRKTVIAKTHGNMPTLGFVEIFGPENHLEVMRQAISTKCVEALCGAWDEKFAVLYNYFCQNGHTNVPDGFYFEGVNLGDWCAYQRYQNKKGLLFDDRVAALESLNFKFMITDHDAVFKTGFKAYVDYIGSHKRKHVPINYETESGFALGVWCKNHRYSISLNRLVKEKLDLLNEVGFPHSLMDSWECKCQSYIDLSIKGGLNPGDVRWINSQVKRFKNSKLSESQVVMLSRIKGVDIEAGVYVSTGLQKRYDITGAPILQPGLLSKDKDCAYVLTGKSDEEWDIEFVKHYLFMGERCSMTEAAQWVEQQRNFIKKGMLTTSQISRLRDSGLVDCSRSGYPHKRERLLSAACGKTVKQWRFESWLIDDMRNPHR